MAVLLRREGSTAPVSHVSSELKNLPRLVVKNSPVHPPATHPGARITARSDRFYACEDPDREEVFKGTYKRRSLQLNQCGFHSVNTRPYKDLGHVELNDGQLILEGLGQSPSEEQIATNPSSREQVSPHHPPPTSLSSPYKVKLRAKTPSQFPSSLANLRQVLDEGEDTLESIRRGKGLFELLKKHEARKLDEETEQVRLQEEERKNEWEEAEVLSQLSLTQSQEDLIKKYSVSLQLEGPAEDKSEMAEHQQVPERGDDSLSDSTALGSWGNYQLKPADLQLALEDMIETPAEEQKQQLPLDNTEDTERWYRMLCVLVWVLEAMRMDSPLHMTPFHKCWDRERLVPDEAKGKRAYGTSKVRLNQWEKLRREQKAISKFRNNRKATMFAQHATSASVKSSPAKRLHEETAEASTRSSTRSDLISGCAKSRKKSRQEQEKMMLKQKKLTPLQMENLLTLLEEELNYSKKQSRNRINEIIKQADEARLRSVRQRRASQLPPLPRLDMEAVTKEFEESEERRKMIAHEQLTAMERDRSKALHQRFSSLKVSGNLWRDLAAMREGVEIETTAMARRKLLMNYEWFPELKAMLPDYVQKTPKCAKLLEILEEIAAFMCEVGPKRMSRRRLIQVLTTLKPWELRNPDVARAVEFLIQRVIYIVAEDYSKWLEQHTLASQKHFKPGSK